MNKVIIIGFIQALFFAILALAKKKKETADYILAALFLLLCYQLFVNLIIVDTGYREEYTHFIGTSGPLTLLYGPLLFFFIKNYISDTQKFKKKYLLHFVPFIIDVLHGFFTFYFQSKAEKLLDIEHVIDGQPDTDLAIFMIFRAIHPLIYSIWSIQVLRVHRKNLLNLYSFSSNKLTLEWLWNLTWSMLIVGTSVLIITCIIVFFDVVDWLELRKIVLVIVVVWVFFLGYYSIRKTPFYRSYSVSGIDTLNYTSLTKQPEKYEKTRLKEDEIPGLKKKLFDYLKGESPYLNKNLTVGELAEAIGIPPYQLSQLINDQVGLSFFELINSYRVEEVKKRFFEPRYSNLTLLGIAMECGFNSKASFNRIFKQFTGQTPTEYIRNKKAA